MFSKSDLRALYTMLGFLLPPENPQARAVETIVEANRLRDVVGTAIQAGGPALERGVKVLEWRLPRAQAPRLNEYAYLKVWMKSRLRKELDDQLRKLIEANPAAKLNGAVKQRWVRVTRFSKNKVDELSVDILGGKMPLDSLVRLNVLHDDSQKWTIREALCRSTFHGNTHVLIEVFDVAAEGVPCEEPKDAPVAQVTRTRGKLTEDICKIKPTRKKR